MASFLDPGRGGMEGVSCLVFILRFTKDLGRLQPSHLQFLLHKRENPLNPHTNSHTRYIFPAEHPSQAIVPSPASDGSDLNSLLNANSFIDDSSIIIKSSS